MAKKKEGESEPELEVEPSPAEETGAPVEADEDRYEVRMLVDQGIGMKPGDLVGVGHTRANRWSRKGIAKTVRKLPKK